MIIREKDIISIKDDTIKFKDIKGKNGFILSEVDWKEVPRYKDNGELKTPEEFELETVEAFGQKYFNQNYKCQFLGSSDTLIDSDALKRIKPMGEDDIIFDNPFYGCRVFEEPKDDRHYILTVDPSVTGVGDSTAMHVFDVTTIPFKQVLAYDEPIPYTDIAEKIYILGNYYNEALIIYETNVAPDVINVVHEQYEYNGEIFEDPFVKHYHLGIKTTKKTKPLNLQMMKTFLENNKLIIQDINTLEEFYNFISRKGSYSAEEGFRDDLVMSCSLLFSIFLDGTKIEDYQGFINHLKSKKEEEEVETVKFLELSLFDDYDLSFDDEDRGNQLSYQNLGGF